MSDFAKQLQAAWEQGRVVVIPPPTPPLPDKTTAIAAAFCRLFGLRPGEARVLGQLLARGHSSRDELCAAAASPGDRPITFDSLRVMTCALRQKIKPHGFTVTTVPKLGYTLAEESRDKIHEQLAKHDPSLTLGSNPKPDQPHTE
jgi:hypothetical protein